MAYLLEKGVSGLLVLKEKSMAMAIFLPSSVESCGGGLCHHLLEKRRSALPIPRRRRMTMVNFLLSSVESCESGHGLCHHLLDGHLLPFLSRKLWR